MNIVILYLLLISNTIFLGFLKTGFTSALPALLLVSIAYLASGALCSFYFRKIAFSKASLCWAVAISLIFVVFNTKSLGVYPSDLVLAQMLAPFCALVFEKKVFFRISDIYPGFILLFLVLIRVGSSNLLTHYSFGVIFLLFITTQASMRKMAEENTFESLLTLGNLVVGFGLLVFCLFSHDSQAELWKEIPSYAYPLLVGLVISLQILFGNVLKKLTPVMSATVLASSLPVSILYEYFFLSGSSLFEMAVVITYLLVLFWVRLMQRA